MAVLNAKDTFGNFLKKGFVESTSRAKDHKALEYYYHGKLILHTKFSHNNDDLRDGLISKISRQCKLDKKEFNRFAKCEMTKEEYIQKLKEQGLVDEA
jgi:predicted RNA binding protein YcfA (HicA-like mRNA interferase family)